MDMPEPNWLVLVIGPPSMWPDPALLKTVALAVGGAGLIMVLTFLLVFWRSVDGGYEYGEVYCAVCDRTYYYKATMPPGPVYDSERIRCPNCNRQIPESVRANLGLTILDSREGYHPA